MGRLEGRVAFVTGAGGGIGRGIAIAFAKEGAKVAIGGRTVSKNQETVDMIKELGGEALNVAIDISKEEDCINAINQIVAEYGQLDILVNNAGVFNIETEKIHEMETEKWNMMVNTNLNGTWMLCKYAIPHLLKSKYANVINISSPAGLGLSIRCAYGATKAAVIQIARSIAIQYPGKIRANVICPGSIDTPGRDGSRKTAAHAKGSVFQLTQRDGKPRDIGAAAVFLASNEGSFVNAATLVVDGGLCGQRPKPEDLAPWTEDEDVEF